MQKNSSSGNIAVVFLVIIPVFVIMYAAIHNSTKGNRLIEKNPQPLENPIDSDVPHINKNKEKLVYEKTNNPIPTKFKSQVTIESTANPTPIPEKYFSLNNGGFEDKSSFVCN
jgi:hypothetical protein